ncbi:hypothetical protein ACTQV2_00590 [Bifidobacterium thermophilum]|uniref:hypothetical protein n=1 Tax=Bifidobacterium thermophilum TaxID=33905 RepID=UPI003F8F8F8E
MQVSWKKHLRPIAALVALFTVGGLFGAVSANASGTTGGTTSSTTGGGYSITVKPYDDFTLKGVVTTARPVTEQMAEAAYKKAGITAPSGLPDSIMKADMATQATIASFIDVSSIAEMPTAQRTGAGRLTVPSKGVWYLSNQFGFTLAKAPGTAYINGYADDGTSLAEVTELTEKVVQTNGGTTNTGDSIADTTASAMNGDTRVTLRPAVAVNRTSKAKVSQAAYETYNYNVSGPITVGERYGGSGDRGTHIFWWQGRAVLCQNPQRDVPPSNVTYTAHTDHGLDTWMEIKRAFYYGFGGPANIFGNNTAAAVLATHFVVAEIFNEFDHQHNFPSDVKNNWWFTALWNKVHDKAEPYGLESMEMVQLANNRGYQWMIFPIYHYYDASFSTQAQTTGDNGSGNWINGGTTADGKFTYGAIDHDTNHVRDVLNLHVTSGIKPSEDTFKVEFWLSADTADGKHYAVKKTKTGQFGGQINDNGTTSIASDEFTPQDLWGKSYWPNDATLYFDENIWMDNYYSRAAKSQGPWSLRGKTNKSESWFRKPTDLTVATEARYYDANGNRVSASPMLNGTQSVLDHLSITPTQQWVRSNETLTYTVTLNYDYDKNGTVDKSATKTKTESTYGGWATGQIHEADSDKFTATDLGLKDGWKPGTYWFDVTVSRLSVEAAPSLSKDSYAHEGKNDAKEKFEIQPHFQLNFLPSVSTKVTADTARDGNPVKDQVTVTMPANRTDLKVTGVTVKARGRLYWSPDKGTEGDAIPQNAKKIADLTPLTFTSDMLADGSETLTYNPATDPKVQAVNAQNRLGTGHYTYVWRIDKSDLIGQTATVTWTVDSKPETQQYPMRTMLQYMNSTVSDGWRPDTEQTTMAAVWTPAILKVGHVGQADGKWMDGRPAANAILNMVETTDATGTTPTATAQTSQIQLKTDGTGVFPTQAIGMGETRYYKVWESQVGKPFNKPKNDAYWMVTAKQTPGTTGVQLTVTGTSDETRWLVRAWTGTDNGTSAGSALKNNPVDWTIKLGDTLDANVTPPVTGSDGDSLRAQVAVAGAATVAGLGAALVLTRRRTHAGRHSA